MAQLFYKTLKSKIRFSHIVHGKLVSGVFVKRIKCLNLDSLDYPDSQD